MKTLKLFFISLCLFALAGQVHADDDAGHHPIDVPFGATGGFDRSVFPGHDVLDEMSDEMLWDEQEALNPSREPVSHQRGRGGGFGFPAPYGFGFPAPSPYGFGVPYPPPYGFGFPAPSPYGFGLPPFALSWGVGSMPNAGPNAAMMSPQMVHCTFGKEHLLASSVESCENAGGKVKSAPSAPSGQ